MSLNDKFKKGVTLVEDGVQLLTLYSIIDLGDQEVQDLQDKSKTTIRSQLILTFELPDLTMEDGRPLAISQTYSASFHEKSGMVASGVAPALLGGGQKARDLLNSETLPEDILKLMLGKTIRGNIGKTQTGKSNKILSAVPLGAKETPPKLHNSLLFVPDADNIDRATREKIPDFILKKIDARKLGTAAVGSNTGDDPFVS